MREISKRGLVISRPTTISNNGFSMGPLSLQELRFSLLFWDKLNYPENFIVHTKMGAETSFLHEAGILERLRVDLPGGRTEIIVAMTQVAAFRALDAAEPGVWSLATGENSLTFDAGELEEGRGALVQIHRAIPVPDKDVHLQDVLDFRARRKSELLKLRFHIEAIYQRVIAAGDGPLAINTETDQLQVAIVDFIKVSRETKFKLRPVSINASLNLIKGVTTGVAGFNAGFSTLASLAAGAGAAISIGPGTALSKREPTGTPFKYVLDYHDEVF